MQIRRSTVLPAAPERVWEALTDDRQLSRWFGAEVVLDPRPGGRGVFRGPDGVRTARVRRVRAGHGLALAWDGDPDAGIDFTITAVPGGTRLDVVETWPAGPQANAAAATWRQRLDVLHSDLMVHTRVLVGV